MGPRVPASPLVPVQDGRAVPRTKELANLRQSALLLLPRRVAVITVITAAALTASLDLQPQKRHPHLSQPLQLAHQNGQPFLRLHATQRLVGKLTVQPHEVPHAALPSQRHGQREAQGGQDSGDQHAGIGTEGRCGRRVVVGVTFGGLKGVGTAELRRVRRTLLGLALDGIRIVVAISIPSPIRGGDGALGSVVQFVPERNGADFGHRRPRPFSPLLPALRPRLCRILRWIVRPFQCPSKGRFRGLFVRCPGLS
mmetsp:Transcript_2289/g.4929  ORF Transcript_2289/g.4929 Transcript_2289/m.4929 type:complete len:254 (-) Transcript_2289:259-1020(-)